MTDPPKREQWQEWMEEFQGESDRACAVLGAAFLDEHLRALLEAFLVDDPNRVQDLFEQAASPLGSFSSRISMSYALGFLAPSEVRDLDLIRKIRNEFAHELHGVSFASPNVTSRCAEFTQCEIIGQRYGPIGPRDRFILSVVLLAHWIAVRSLRFAKERRVIHKGVKRSDEHQGDA